MMSHKLVCMHDFRRCASKFRIFSQKYKAYEIKSRTKVSAIAVLVSLSMEPLRTFFFFFWMSRFQ